MTNASDTIFAVSSGRLPAAIAIVRVSGPRAGETLLALTGLQLAPRKATLAKLKAQSGDMIDEALALWFPGPHSDTGEDVAEFHIHGSRAVVAALFEELARLGLRPAEPGEFTRRSVENGKRDLTAAEGLFDLINSETQAQRRLALRHLNGLLGGKADSWRQQIIAASALIEAAIDFPDEGDVPAELLEPAMTKVRALRQEIEQALDDGGRGERLREGLVVAIAGAPNAGKSTLLNHFARREVAIVSPIAGTTRDIIEVHLDLAGYPVTLLDTAGIRDTDDPVEQEGVRRARERGKAADLVLWLTDVSTSSANDRMEMANFGDVAVWRVDTKIDLASPASAGSPQTGLPSFAISACEGMGLADLEQAIARFAEGYFGAAESSLIIRARQRDILYRVINSLQNAEDARDSGEDIVAEELRISIHLLGVLLGRIDIEDVLDAIFRDFCIGK